MRGRMGLRYGREVAPKLAKQVNRFVRTLVEVTAPFDGDLDGRADCFVIRANLILEERCRGFLTRIRVAPRSEPDVLDFLDDRHVGTVW